MPSILLSAFLATQALAFPVPQGLSGILGGLSGSSGSSSTSGGGLGSLLGGLGGNSGSSGTLGSLGSLLGSLGGASSSSGSGLGGLGGLAGSNSTNFPGFGSIGGLGGSGSSGSGLGSLGSSLGSLGSGSSSPLSGVSSIGGDTANDVQNGVCKSTTFVCARGTTEGGNLGETVCPDLANKLKSDLNNDVAVQGVNYPADVEGAVEGAVSTKTAQGSENMANLVNQALQKCPNTKVVLAGYSQGAEQVHGALQNLDPSTASKISAVTTFGDPLQKQAFQGVPQSKVKVFCAQGDGVCDGTFSISAAHLSYTQTSITPAAQFIQGNIKN